MTWLPLIAIVVSLLGGGAMGAVISAAVTRHRTKRQPVVYQKEVIEIFKKNPEFASLQGILRIGDLEDSGPGYAVDNLSVVRYSLTNKGNQDIPDYKFGITLEGGNSAVDVKTETPDRHHVAQVLTPVSISDRKTELDFSLQPFNRSDKYEVNVYFTYHGKAGSIRLSSPHPSNLTKLVGSSGNENVRLWLTLLNAITSAVMMIGFMVFLFSLDKGKLAEILKALFKK